MKFKFDTETKTVNAKNHKQKQTEKNNWEQVDLSGFFWGS